jgi:hypothetical protein
MSTQLIQIIITIIKKIIPGNFLEVLSEIFLVFEEENNNIDISSLTFRCDLTNIFCVPNPIPDPSPVNPASMK